MQNMRKRLDSDVENRTRARTEGLLSEFITLQDHLSLAIDSMPEDMEKDQNAKIFAQGVKAIYMSMEMLLTRYGVLSIKPKNGEPFNPEEHEAIRSEDREDLESEQIELIRTGYRMGKRILRPAQICLLRPTANEANPEQ